MAVSNPDSVIIAIDTNQYSGKFEREMVAFITGQFGECNVGLGIAEEARDELINLDWFDEHTVKEADDTGCERPASIWPTPPHLYEKDPRSVVYHSVAYFVDEVPPQEVLEEIYSRAQLYCASKSLKLLNLRVLAPKYEQVLVAQVVGYTEVALPKLN